MVTNEEDVPRFSLRRGARFQETFRDEPGREAPDDEWLADLGEDFDGDQSEDAQSRDAGDVEVAGDQLEELAALAFDPSSPLTDSPPAGSPPAEQVAQPVHVDQPSLDDAVSALAENLAHLEEVLARTAAACSVARMVLRQGQALLDHPSSSPATPTSVDHAPVVGPARPVG